MKLLRIAILSSLLLGLFAGCTGQPTVENKPLRVALLPILDVLPVYVAYEAGYFKEQGLDIQFVSVASAAERDQVVAAGQADVLVNDLLSVALYNRKDIQVQVVQFARLTAAGSPLYRILASRQSGIKSVKELAGVPIAISQGSIIDYVTNQILVSQGLANDQIKTIAVPKIPDRLALLASGQVQAATLPEPFSTEAIQQGAVLIVDDTGYAEIANSVISFRKKVLDERPQVATQFLAAFNKAVDELNAHPDTWRKLLDQYKLVPTDIVQNYPMPKFPAPGLPNKKQFDAVVQWALERKLIDQNVVYSLSMRKP
jgi:NitT/TauT family transport system substrate-binding protein